MWSKSPTFLHVWLLHLITSLTIGAKINTLDDLMSPITQQTWRCPEIAQQPAVECSCDMPHTLRCNGEHAEAMRIIGRKLRSLPPRASVSLLDCTVQNVSTLPGPLFEGVTLHGLVVSSGKIKDVHKHAFMGLAAPLQALGLPNNQLSSVPTAALAALPALDRLDLSHNMLKRLDNTSFKGLGNLSFLDLSDNKISEITKNAFTTLPQLKTLRLRGNCLTISMIATLKPLPGITNLDLSSNNLVGPLEKHTIPSMPTLKTLQLSQNKLTSMKKGTLEGFPNLESLILHHNKIDVLEDYAFENLKDLKELDLSYNQIVAVSGASLAHLENLLELDLSHNYLRAVTADLILPLKKLDSLNLDDNDISIIASDAFKADVVLTKLNLAENPLNCDCSLIEFATWLSNSSTLSSDDKNSAVCMTPPSLENALIAEISLDALHCGEDEHEPIMAPPSSLVDEIPVANVRVTFQNLFYNENVTRLQWSVDEKAIPYTCDRLFIYEDQTFGEMLIETRKFECDSWNMTNPEHLNVEINDDLGLEYGNKYRFCIVLFEGGVQSDDISLIVGCSDIVTLVKSDSILQVKNKMSSVISDLNVDFTIGNILVNVDVAGSKSCMLNIALLENGGTLLSEKRVNCSESHYIFRGVHDGPYEICATIVQTNDDDDGLLMRPFCVPAQIWPTTFSANITNIILIVVCIVLSITLIVLIWGVKKVLTRPKVQTHQYFLPPTLEEEQHSRYVKLQATTKL